MKTNENLEVRRISDFFPEISDEYIVNKESTIYSKRLNRNFYPYVTPDGMRISLMDKFMEQNTYSMHTIINKCFNGFPPDTIKKPITKHIDGDKFNNDPSNLVWIDSVGENSYVRYKNIEYSDEDVVNMFKMRDEGKSNDEIANFYNTHKNYIYKILSGQTRKDVIDKYNLKPNVMQSAEEIYQNRINTVINIAKCIIKNMGIRDIMDEIGCKRKMIWKVRTKQHWEDELQYYDFENNIDFTEANNEVNIYDSEKITIGETEYRF